MESVPAIQHSSNCDQFPQHDASTPYKKRDPCSTPSNDKTSPSVPGNKTGTSHSISPSKNANTHRALKLKNKNGGKTTGELVLSLPEDVEKMIFLKVDRNARVIANLRLVCRRWKHVLDGMEPIWRQMKLTLPYRNPDQAEKWYRKAAACGNADGMFLLGLLYLYGFRSDLNQAPMPQPSF